MVFATLSQAAQHRVHPIPDKHRGHGGGSLRVFDQFSWLKVGYGKVELSRPAHQGVTRAVSTLALIGGATMLLNFFGLIGILDLMPSHTNRFLSVSALFDGGLLNLVRKPNND